MPRSKKVQDKIEAEEAEIEDTPTDKEILTHLYETMKIYGINSIGDVEVKLARL